MHRLRRLARQHAARRTGAGQATPVTCSSVANQGFVPPQTREALESTEPSACERSARQFSRLTALQCAVMRGSSLTSADAAAAASSSRRSPSACAAARPSARRPCARPARSRGGAFTSSPISARSLTFSSGMTTVLMPARKRRQQLLLEAADRQHAAAQRDLARHGHVLPARECPVMMEMIAVTMATPAEGPSLGVAPSGTCTWMSFFSNMRRWDAERMRARAHVGVGGLDRIPS